MRYRNLEKLFNSAYFLGLNFVGEDHSCMPSFWGHLFSANQLSPWSNPQDPGCCCSSCCCSRCIPSTSWTQYFEHNLIGKRLMELNLVWNGTLGWEAFTAYSLGATKKIECVNAKKIGTPSKDFVECLCLTCQIADILRPRWMIWRFESQNDNQWFVITIWEMPHWKTGAPVWSPPVRGVVEEFWKQRMEKLVMMTIAWRLAKFDAFCDKTETCNLTDMGLFADSCGSFLPLSSRV